MRSRIVAPVLFASLMSMAACSFTFLTSPPTYPDAEAQVKATGNIRCSRWPILPGVDLGIAGAAGLLTLVVTTPRVDLFGDGGIDTAVGAAIAAGFVASAVWGFLETSECRDLYRALDAERHEWKRQRYGR